MADSSTSKTRSLPTLQTDVVDQSAIDRQGLDRLIRGTHENPFEILGPHEIQAAGRRQIAVRAYLPSTSQAWVIDGAHGSTPRPMQRVHPAGLFEAVCDASERMQSGHYRLETTNQHGQRTTMHDPYSFPPLLSEYDLYLLAEGRHWDSYHRLGAHVREINGISGVNFAVWAPNAAGVSVVGDFNDWDGRVHPMRKHIPSGFWELFVPDVRFGATYKFRVSNGGEVADRSDPYAFAAELPPRTASVVADLDNYTWNDADWMAARRESNGLDAPISVYEVHLGSWKRPWDGRHWHTYRELAELLAEYCLEMGYTHVELLPVSEHPLTASWGYQTLGYFAATSRYGSAEDLMYLVDHLHQHGIGVLLDWVPAHFPRDAHGLRMFDGSHLYEHADPRQGEHADWGTLIFNYGRNEVRNFLLSNALFWLDRYHIDGLRVDAVASMLYLDYSREEGQWVPNEYGGRENLQAISFLKEFNELVHGRHPGVLTIAEESTSYDGVTRPTNLGGLGFSLKWNMGWMNDTRRYMHREPVHRQYHHNDLTFSLLYAFSENFMLPLSHDEVVHGKGSLLDQMPGDEWQRFANLRLLFSYMWTHPGKKLLFMGGDFGQWNEWNFDQALEWDLLKWEPHQGIKKCVADLNQLYRRESALYEVEFDGQGFEWVDCADYQSSTLSYLRRGKSHDDFLLIAANFTPVLREGHRLGVPEVCRYVEIFNSDSEYYGGGNQGNGVGLEPQSKSWHGRPASVDITIPPLGLVVLKPDRQ